MAQVRTAEPRDLPQILAIAQESATAAQWNRKEYENLFAQESPPHRIAMVIEENHAVCGFIVAKQIGEEWEIENVAVAQEMRHRGLGTQLLNSLLDMVRKQNGSVVFLEVRESNLAARALYGKRGFKESGRRKNYYENPPEDALILRFIFSI